jgi:hypothetical protein
MRSASKCVGQHFFSPQKLQSQHSLASAGGAALGIDSTPSNTRADFSSLVINSHESKGCESGARVFTCWSARVPSINSMFAAGSGTQSLSHGRKLICGQILPHLRPRSVGMNFMPPRVCTWPFSE